VWASMLHPSDRHEFFDGLAGQVTYNLAVLVTHFSDCVVSTSRAVMM
jgi:hypothetical protein